MEPIKRKTDQVGRVLIPRHIRALYDILEEGTEVEVVPVQEGVLVRKYRPTCILCGASEDLVIYRDKNICRSCIKDLTDLT